ncbi:hypothetical protein ACHAWF_005521, partial [Thalassiosira exigua]
MWPASRTQHMPSCTSLSKSSRAGHHRPRRGPDPGVGEEGAAGRGGLAHLQGGAGEARTIELPADKPANYMAELRRLLRKKIVEKLWFAAICLPAGRTLMSPLNQAMKGDPKVINVGRNTEVHESLGDWLQLIKDLGKRPTSVHELVARTVDFYGYCDACNTGAGGVWLPLDSEVEPFLWRVRWPPDIVRRLAAYDGLSISDAECAGVVLQQLALEQVVGDLRHKKGVAFCDNTPSV